MSQLLTTAALNIDNTVYTIVSYTATNDDTPKTLAEYPIQEGYAYSFQGLMVITEGDNSHSGSAYVLVGAAREIGEDAHLSGTPIVDPTWSFTPDTPVIAPILNVTNDAVIIQVTGLPGTLIKWRIVTTRVAIRF